MYIKCFSIILLLFSMTYSNNITSYNYDTYKVAIEGNEMLLIKDDCIVDRKGILTSFPSSLKGFYIVNRRAKIRIFFVCL